MRARVLISLLLSDFRFDGLCFCSIGGIWLAEPVVEHLQGVKHISPRGDGKVVEPRNLRTVDVDGRLVTLQMYGDLDTTAEFLTHISVLKSSIDVRDIAFRCRNTQVNDTTALKCSLPQHIVASAVACVPECPVKNNLMYLKSLAQFTKDILR